MLIFAIFALLVFVGITREFMPSRWSFRSLRWKTGVQQNEGDVKIPENYNQNNGDSSAPTVTSVMEVIVTPVPAPPKEEEGTTFLQPWDNARILTISDSREAEKSFKGASNRSYEMARLYTRLQ
jgi:hypothetical protein